MSRTGKPNGSQTTIGKELASHSGITSTNNSNRQAFK